MDEVDGSNRSESATGCSGWVKEKVTVYSHRLDGSERSFIALDYGNLATLDKVRTTDEVEEPEFLDLTSECVIDFADEATPVFLPPSESNEEIKAEAMSPQHGNKEEQKLSSTVDTGRYTTEAAPQNLNRPAFCDKVVSELKANRGGILEIISKVSLLPHVLEHLTEEEQALAYSRELYHICAHEQRYFELAGTSGVMQYPEGVAGSDVLLCVRCFAEWHQKECNSEVKKKNTERQFKIAVKLHKLTGNLDQYRVICNNCKVPSFKLPHQRIAVCFMCKKALKKVNVQ